MSENTEPKKALSRSAEALETISRLTRELEAVKSESKGHRIAKRNTVEENNQLRIELDKIRKEFDEIKNRKQPSPDERLQELEALKAEVRTSKHRDAFAKVAKDLGIREDAVQDAYALSGYSPTDTDPDTDAIKEILEGTLANRPYLKGEVKAAKEKVAGPGVSRGSSSRGGFTVTREQLQDSQWLYYNQSKYAAAVENGTVNVVD